nr:Ger(x)C family spore germination protein [Bacillus sp. DNRA2]
MRKIRVSLLLLPLLLSGCWSSVEIHDMAVTNIMGIDINKAGEYEVTARIVRPGALFSPVMNEKIIDENQNKTIIETATGKTIYKALNQLSNSIPEKIYLGHMDTILLSKTVAREKMQQTLDFFHRENQFRPNIKLLITKEKPSEIIRTAPEFNATLGQDILDFSKNNRNVAANTVVDISQFMKVFTSDTADPVTGVLTTAKKLGIKAEGENQKLKENHKDMVTVASLFGSAIFKNGKLVGVLNENETRGLLWIRGGLKNEVIVLPCGKNQSENVSVMIRDTQSEMIPDEKAITKKLKVKTTIQADIGEVTCSELDLNSDTIEELNEQLETLATREAKAILTKVKNQWQTDVFGFGEAIYRKNPSEWRKMAPTWRKDGLKNLQVEIDVDASISRFGVHKNPSKAYESR